VTGYDGLSISVEEQMAALTRERFLAVYLASGGKPCAINGMYLIVAQLQYDLQLAQ